MTLLAALLLVSAQPALAPREAAALSPQLQPLAFLAGSCWRGTFPNGRQTDTHCFTPMLGGAFVRDLHVVEGAPAPYSGETLYRWEPEGRRIVYDYYASDGSHSAGNALTAANGLVFPEEAHRAPDGAEQLIRSSWTRDGPDAYVVLAETMRGEAWQPLWQMRMVRVGPASASAETRGPELNPHLEPLALLAGWCWRATHLGGRATDTSCYTAMLGGNFLRDRKTFTGVHYSGEAIYRWDAAAGRIRADYYFSDGRHISGTLRGAQNGLIVEAGHVSPQGASIAARGTWTFGGPAGFVVVSEVREGDSWRPAGTIRYERVSAAPAD